MKKTSKWMDYLVDDWRFLTLEEKVESLHQTCKVLSWIPAIAVFIWIVSYF